MYIVFFLHGWCVFGARNGGLVSGYTTYYVLFYFLAKWRAFSCLLRVWAVLFGGRRSWGEVIFMFLFVFKTFSSCRTKRMRRILMIIAWFFGSKVSPFYCCFAGWILPVWCSWLNDQEHLFFFCFCFCFWILLFHKFLFVLKTVSSCRRKETRRNFDDLCFAFLVKGFFPSTTVLLHG
jgi:hypothetical protein